MGKLLQCCSNISMSESLSVCGSVCVLGLIASTGTLEKSFSLFIRAAGGLLGDGAPPRCSNHAAASKNNIHNALTSHNPPVFTQHVGSCLYTVSQQTEAVFSRVSFIFCAGVSDVSLLSDHQEFMWLHWKMILLTSVWIKGSFSPVYSWSGCWVVARECLTCFHLTLEWLNNSSFRIAVDKLMD